MDDALLERKPEQRRGAADAAAVANRTPSATPAQGVQPLGFGQGHASQAIAAIPCQNCGASNPAERKFCGGCGQTLWEPCLKCDATNGRWEKFCGGCGGNLVTMVQQRVDECTTVHSQARAQVQLCRHREALQTLSKLAASEHPRLAALWAETQRMLEEIRLDADRCQLETQELLAAAQQSFTAYDYDQTVQTLQRIHPQLRDGDAQRLLEKALAAQQEALALAGQIRDDLAAKQYAGLLAKVQRLLELKPSHDEARTLAARLAQFEQRNFEQSRAQLAKAAQAKLAEHEYAEAAALFNRIHPSVRSPEALKLLEHATSRAQEVAWLSETLRSFAVFDEHLLPFAERLVKLRPNDEKASKLAARIGQLEQQRVQQRELPKSLPAKGATQFGFPLDLLTGCQRIDDEKLHELDAYRQNAGGFYVAFGLALQALEKSAVQTNLLPNQKKGVLSRLAGAMLRKKSKAAWGFDIGQSALKAIKLSWDADHDQVRAEVCEHIEYEKPLSQPDAEPERMVRQAFEQLLEKHKLEEDSVCVGYPGPKTLARFIKLPPTEHGKVAELVKYEAKQQIPFALETVTWDFQVTASGPEISAGVCEREVGIFAVRTDEAVQFLFPLVELKIKVDMLQSESVALHNYLSFDRFEPDAAPAEDAMPQAPLEEAESDDEVTAVLDIGSDCTNLVVGNRKLMWVRTIPLGAGQFNKPLIGEFQLTHEKAELLKRQPTKAPLVSKVYQAMQPAVRDLSSEVQRSLTYFEHTYRQRRIARMFVVGNGARLHGLLKMLRGGSGGSSPETPA